MQDSRPTDDFFASTGHKVFEAPPQPRAQQQPRGVDPALGFGWGTSKAVGSVGQAPTMRAMPTNRPPLQAPSAWAAPATDRAGGVPAVPPVRVENVEAVPKRVINKEKEVARPISSQTAKTVALFGLILALVSLVQYGESKASPRESRTWLTLFIVFSVLTMGAVSYASSMPPEGATAQGTVVRVAEPPQGQQREAMTVDEPLTPQKDNEEGPRGNFEYKWPQTPGREIAPEELMRDPILHNMNASEFQRYMKSLEGYNINPPQVHRDPYYTTSPYWEHRQQVDDAELVHGIPSQPLQVMRHAPMREAKREQGGARSSHLKDPVEGVPAIPKVHPWMLEPQPVLPDPTGPHAMRPRENQRASAEALVAETLKQRETLDALSRGHVDPRSGFFDAKAMHERELKTMNLTGSVEKDAERLALERKIMDEELAKMLEAQKAQTETQMQSIDTATASKLRRIQQQPHPGEALQGALPAPRPATAQAMHSEKVRAMPDALAPLNVGRGSAAAASSGVQAANKASDASFERMFAEESDHRVDEKEVQLLVSNSGRSRKR